MVEPSPIGKGNATLNVSDRQVPLIAVTTYGANAEGEYHLRTTYVESIRRAGGACVLLPPSEPHLERIFSAADGLILAGGGDIAPHFYRGADHPLIYMVDESRDRMELQMAQSAVERNFPLLAICRGLQVLNVAHGGTLHPHLPDVYGETIPHRSPPRDPGRHTVAIEAGSRLADILRTVEPQVVSWHHQAAAEIGPRLRVVARAPDGVVEACEVTDRENCIGVQWHPEISAAADPVQQRIFDWLVDRCRQQMAFKAKG